MKNTIQKKMMMLAGTLILVMTTLVTTFAAETERKGTGIGDYDPVSYPISGKPLLSTGNPLSEVDGRFYVNRNNRIKAIWITYIPDNIKKADINWPTPPSKHHYSF